jgi:hypothetical protein
MKTLRYAPGQGEHGSRLAVQVIRVLEMKLARSRCGSENQEGEPSIVRGSLGGAGHENRLRKHIVRTVAAGCCRAGAEVHAAECIEAGPIAVLSADKVADPMLNCATAAVNNRKFQ